MIIDCNPIPEEVLASTFYLIGTSTAEYLINKYPDCFKGLIEHRRKWALVPESAKEEYYEELRKLTHKYFSTNQFSTPGIFVLMSDPVERAKADAMLESEEYKEYNRKHQEQEDQLYNRYFNKYGLTK